MRCIHISQKPPTRRTVIPAKSLPRIPIRGRYPVPGLWTLAYAGAPPFSSPYVACEAMVIPVQTPLPSFPCKRESNSYARDGMDSRFRGRDGEASYLFPRPRGKIEMGAPAFSEQVHLENSGPLPPSAGKTPASSPVRGG